MKTKIFTIVAILMLNFTLSFASDPQSNLKQTIYSKISYPEFAIEKQIEGAVFVEFKVKEDGKIEVLNCTSLNGELQSYVFLAISGMTVETNPDITGETYLMRFDFILE